MRRLVVSFVLVILLALVLSGCHPAIFASPKRKTINPKVTAAEVKRLREMDTNGKEKK